jgi:hypothetical protein
MATQTIENINRLPPFLEGLQKRMLQTGFGEFNADGTQTTAGLLDRSLGLPEYQMAGMDPLRNDAMRLGQQNVGSYLPFIEGAKSQDLAAQQALAGGLGTLQRGLNPLGRADQMISGAEGITRGGLGDLASGRQAIAGGLQDFNLGRSAVSSGLQDFNAGRSAVASGLQDFNAGRGAIGEGQSYLQQASNLADPSQGVSQFMDPYQQQVIDATMSQLDRQADLQRQGNASQAIQSGAFGGGREGIQRAETDRNLQQVKSDTLSKLLSSNYAQALAGSQNAAKLQAGLGQASGELGARYGSLGQGSGELGSRFGALGQGSGELGARFGALGQGRGDLGARYGSLGQTAGTLGTGVGQLGANLGNIANQYSTIGGRQGNIGQQFGELAGTTTDIGRLQQALGQADVSQLGQLGAMRQQQQQAGLDAYRQNQMQAAQEPYTRLQIGQNLLQGMPSSSIPSTFTQSTTPSANPFLQGVGAYTTLSQISPFGGGQNR